LLFAKKYFPRRPFCRANRRPDCNVKEEMMGKIIAIDRGRFLGDYSSRQKAPTVIGNGSFLLGVLATIVVPQLVYCASGGPISPWLFVVSAQAGVIAGLVKYIRPPATLAALLAMRTTPRAQGDRTKRRKLS
jgi:hypothetical protein